MTVANIRLTVTLEQSPEEVHFQPEGTAGSKGTAASCACCVQEQREGRVPVRGIPGWE